MTKSDTNFWASRSTPDLSVAFALEGMAAAADILILMDQKTIISDVMVGPENEALGCLDHWIGRTVDTFLTEESTEKLKTRLSKIDVDVAGSSLQRKIELNHVDNATWDTPIEYSILRDPETKNLLMVGRDLSAVAMIQRDLVDAQIALERDFEASRDYQTRYRAVLETIPDALVLLSPQTGTIQDINSAAAKLFGEEPAALKNAAFAEQFKEETKLQGLYAIFSGRGGESFDENYEFTVRLPERPVTLSFTPVRSAGQHFVLCLIRPDIKVSSSDMRLPDQLSQLFDNSVDAIVFTDNFGSVTNCNMSFLDLCDASSVSEVRNRPLGDFLARGVIDQRMLTETLSKSNNLRSFNTKTLSNFNTSLPVNISGSRLTGAKNSGFVFVMRLMSAASTRPDTEADIPKAASQNVIRLVGAAPLKEIVAGTADVIEKLCIEAALDMTGNNRVAAAEMLGLSRQSLYVKLRKYQMLSPKSRN